MLCIYLLCNKPNKDESGSDENSNNTTVVKKDIKNAVTKILNAIGKVIVIDYVEL